jgi:hypothetical protein
MIPSASIDVTLSSSDTTETSRTYRLSNGSIQGFVEEQEALQQAIYLMLNTEKYEYPIFSFSYGIELENLIGQDQLYVQMELMRRIKECLLTDDRIQNVENFTYSITKDSILCTFDVVSIYGISTFNKEVNV